MALSESVKLSRLSTAISFNERIRFCALQVQRNSLSINKDDAAVDQFLAGAVILLIANQRLKRYDKLDGHAAGLPRLMHRGGEIYSLKLRVVMEVFSHRPQH